MFHLLLLGLVSFWEYGSSGDFSDKPERPDNLPLRTLRIDIGDVLTDNIVKIPLKVPNTAIDHPISHIQYTLNTRLGTIQQLQPLPLRPLFLNPQNIFLTLTRTQPIFLNHCLFVVHV